MKADYRFSRITDARIQIAQHVERGKVIRINCNDLTVFFYGSSDLSRFEILLGCAQSLCFVKNHLNPKDWKTFENCREVGWLEGAMNHTAGAFCGLTKLTLPNVKCQRCCSPKLP